MSASLVPLLYPLSDPVCHWLNQSRRWRHRANTDPDEEYARECSARSLDALERACAAARRAVQTQRLQATNEAAVARRKEVLIPLLREVLRRREAERDRRVRVETLWRLLRRLAETLERYRRRPLVFRGRRFLGARR